MSDDICFISCLYKTVKYITFLHLKKTLRPEDQYIVHTVYNKYELWN